MDDNTEDGFEAEENYYAFLNISPTASVSIDFSRKSCNFQRKL